MSTTVTAPTAAPTSADLTTALQALMGSESTSAGVATVLISTAGTPDKTAWGKTTTDSYIGGYPDEATAKSTESGGVVLATAIKNP